MYCSRSFSVTERNMENMLTYKIHALMNYGNMTSTALVKCSNNMTFNALMQEPWQYMGPLFDSSSPYIFKAVTPVIYRIIHNTALSCGIVKLPRVLYCNAIEPRILHIKIHRCKHTMLLCDYIAETFHGT